MTIKTRAAQAAAQIRAKLKAEGVPATVRSSNYAGGCSITVKLDNPLPATRKAVEAFAHQYQIGSFDGMTDCYNVDNRRDDIPQVSYVFVEAVFDNDTRQAAWDWIRANLGGLESAPAYHYEAGNYRVEAWACYGSDLIWRVLAGSHGLDRFWFTRKPRITCAA